MSNVGIIQKCTNTLMCKIIMLNLGVYWRINNKTVWKVEWNNLDNSKRIKGQVKLKVCSPTYGKIPLICYLIIWKCGLEVFLFTTNKLQSVNEESLWDTFKKAFKRLWTSTVVVISWPLFSPSNFCCYIDSRRQRRGPWTNR